MKRTLREMIHFYPECEEFKTMHSLAGGVWSGGSPLVLIRYYQNKCWSGILLLLCQLLPTGSPAGSRNWILDSSTSFPNKWII